MAGVFSAVLNKRVKTEAKIDLITEIERTKLKLQTVESHFESQSDPDLVEANVYEIKSLTARYRYLLREARIQGVTKDIKNTLVRTDRT